MGVPLVTPKEAPLPDEKQSGLTKLMNGLFGALFGMGFPGGYPGGGTQKVSQTGDLFSNLRWYLASNFRQQLAQSYCELGLIQTICRVPVEDGLRGEHEIVSKELSPEELVALLNFSEEFDDIGKVEEALIWKRLFGGAGIVANTTQDPATKLDALALYGKPFELKAVDMWELYYNESNIDGDDGPKLGMPGTPSYTHYDFYGVRLDRTRVLHMKGIAAPSFLRPKLRGWGLSVVDILIRSINQYLKGTGLIYELLDEAKIDVYGINELANTLLGQNGTELVRQRIQMANAQKNYQHALVMDSKDTYTQKTLTFSGLADVMKEVRFQVASDMRMPLTKLFGISASGFNSGEDDIEVYNGMVESSVRKDARRALASVYKLRCAQLFGKVPSDLKVKLAPMRLMSAEEEQNVKSKKFERISKAKEQGAITLEEYRDACNRAELFDVQLAPLEEVEDELEAEAEASDQEEEGSESEGGQGAQEEAPEKKEEEGA